MGRMSGALRAQFGGVGDAGMAKRAVVETERVGKGPQSDEGDMKPFVRQDFEGEFDNRVQDKKLYQTKITFDDVVEGCLIKIQPQGGGEVFRLGSPDVEESMKPVIREMGDYMRTQRVRVLIHVYVDAKTWQYSRSKSAWELTAAQAESVAALLEEAGMTPELVGIAPEGDRAPRVTDDSATGRALNRRVEISVMPLENDPLFDPESKE